MLSSVARLGQANQVSKNYAPVSFNFVRGGSISKMSARVPANFKSNAVRAKIGENLKNSFRASNLRKLPMSKSF